MTGSSRSSDIYKRYQAAFPDDVLDPVMAAAMLGSVERLEALMQAALDRGAPIQSDDVQASLGEWQADKTSRSASC